MEPEGKIMLTILSIYYVIGLILAFSCRIWYLKTCDAYHTERMNPFAYWLGHGPSLTVVAWPFWIVIAFVDFFIKYLPYKITGKTDLTY